MLLAISLVVELSALLMAIGLGLYLITRSVNRLEAWLAALTSWSIGGLFLNMLFSLTTPPIAEWMSAFLVFWPKAILEQDPGAWLQGWTSTLAPAFWFNTTMLMRNGRMHTRQRIAVFSGYAFCLVGIAIQALRPQAYNVISGDLLFLNALQGGHVYGIFLGFLVLINGLSIRNLILAARVEPRSLPRRQLIMLSAATILAGLTGPVGLMAAFLKIPVPMFLIALLIGAGVLATGYGVARYSALMEHRVFQRDFYYTFFVNSLAVAFYLGIAGIVFWSYPFPLYIFILVGILAVISHYLIDVARQNVDFVFFQQEKYLLRARLRSLESQNVADLLMNFSHLLENVCEPAQASYAVLFVRRNAQYEQVAAYHLQQTALTLPFASLSADDVRSLQPGELPEHLSKAALLSPIYLGDQQVGALVLGASEHGLAYSPIELSEIQEFSDYLGGWLGYLILERIEHSEQLQEELKPELGFLGGSAIETSTRVVELALRNLHDCSRLAELPLASMNLVRQRGGNTSASHLETGKAIYGLLCEGIEMLRPTGDLDEKRKNYPPKRDWYPYIILHDAYVKGHPNRDIMDRLYISEGTFNRTRRSAIRSLARILADMEKQAAH